MNVNVLINHRIKSDKVYCIDHSGTNLGIITLVQAMKIANSVCLDVVQVSKTNGYPLCKILDSGKYKYEMEKKEKDRLRQQRESAIKIKEIRFRPTTDKNDLMIKATKAREMINDGCRVVLSCAMKGREVTYKQAVIDKLNVFLEYVNNGTGMVQFLDQPKCEGRNITATIAQVKP
jgi:translation initiation factor IF-3